MVLPVSPDYYSLHQMHADGRLRQSEAVVRKGQITTFFIDRMNEFMASCKTNSGGDMVVRAKGKSPDVLKQYIEQHYPDVDVRIFEASPINNIASLDRLLSKDLPHPFVAIIRGSLRAGKTLTTTKHIRMWIEPPTSKTDTMCQVVGRCVGFEMVGGKNRRFEDRFPIYCNIREINEALAFFDYYKCTSNPTNVNVTVPVGIQNKSTVEKEEFEIELYDYDYVRKEFDAIGKDATKLPDDYKFWDEKQNPPEYMPKRVGTVTGNIDKNLCQFVLSKQGNWSAGNIIHIDGAPATPEHPQEHMDAYNKLKGLLGDIDGKYVYFKPSKRVKIEYSDKISKNCLLNIS